MQQAVRLYSADSPSEVNDCTIPREIHSCCPSALGLDSSLTVPSPMLSPCAYGPATAPSVLFSCNTSDVNLNYPPPATNLIESNNSIVCQQQDELRRALTIAGGTDATPPTTKDMDDLFTLLSSQSSGGVRGGRVDAATILCAIRGKLSPFREKVVRNVFHEIFGPSGNKNSGTRTGTGRISGDNAGLGECCSSIGLGPGGEGGRNSSRAGDGNKLDTAGGRAPPQGVSIEQFLEYYRWVR